MAMRCPDCGTSVVEELAYCFGCFRHLAERPETVVASEPKRSRLRGRKNPKAAAEDVANPADAPDAELVDATPKQTFMTWEPGAIPKGTLTFGAVSQESDWRRRTVREDH